MRPAPLPPDSLAAAFVLAARAVARVLDGHNVDEGLAAARAQTLARAQAQELAYGALRRHAWGRFLLGRLIRRPLTQHEISGLLLCALHRLETRPEAVHTTVDQAVAAAGVLARGAYRGLVNGVLRNYLRQRDALLAALAGDDEALHRHPGWWLRRLRAQHPGDWAAIVDCGNAQPPMALRVNRRQGDPAAYLARLDAAGIPARAIGEDGVLLASPCPVEALPGFADGAVSVQDPGAQEAAALLDAADGMRVLDACAAPGGKTAHLLERYDLDLTALELDGGRCRRIEENLSRLGLRATVRETDCRRVDAWWDGRPFDRILADVPCSASGVVRRHPDAKWLRRPGDLARFAATQAEILDALWPTLAVGGRLLYATCSVFAEENTAQIAAWLARQPSAALEEERQLLPGAGHDGFYYARLRKLA